MLLTVSATASEIICFFDKKLKVQDRNFRVKVNYDSQGAFQQETSQSLILKFSQVHR